MTRDVQDDFKLVETQQSILMRLLRIFNSGFNKIKFLDENLLFAVTRNFQFSLPLVKP